MQIIATGLTTVATTDSLVFLEKYMAVESVERILIGWPLNWDESETDATPLVKKFIQALQKKFPQIPITKIDERFSSKMAKDAMLAMGMKKKQRRKKALVDEIAATILLQEYLKTIH